MHPSLIRKPFLPALILLPIVLAARFPGPKPPPASTTRLLSRLAGEWSPADLYNIRLQIDVNREDGGVIYTYSGNEERPYEASPFRVTGPDRYKDLTTGYTFALRFATVGKGKQRRTYMTVRLVEDGKLSSRARRFVRWKKSAKDKRRA